MIQGSIVTEQTHEHKLEYRPRKSQLKQYNFIQDTGT